MLVIYYHLRKCGGTSVREMFTNNKRFERVDQFGAVSFLNKDIFSEENAGKHLFWERHTNPHIQKISEDTKKYKNYTNNVYSFITMRNPISIVKSEYNYFHKDKISFESFIKNNPNLLLYGTQTCDKYPFLGFNKSNNCGSIIMETIKLFRHLDDVFFIDMSYTELKINRITNTSLNVINTRNYSLHDETLIKHYNTCSIKLYQKLLEEFYYKNRIKYINSKTLDSIFY